MLNLILARNLLFLLIALELFLFYPKIRAKKVNFQLSQSEKMAGYRVIWTK